MTIASYAVTVHCDFSASCRPVNRCKSKAFDLGTNCAISCERAWGNPFEDYFTVHFEEPVFTSDTVVNVAVIVLFFRRFERSETVSIHEEYHEPPY